MEADVRQRTYITFERAVELPMLVLALLMVPLLLIPELFDLSDALSEAFFVAEWFIWAVFAIELAVKTYLSDNRFRYLKTHWYDVVIVVVPFLRPLRVIRSLRVLRAARGMRLVSFTARFAHSSRALIDSHGIKYALLAGGLLFFAAAGLALVFERDGGGNINSFGDAVWWAAATITTVGYGDRYPVTTEGRAIAVFLMFLGISLFSLITASVAALFVLPEQREEEATLADVLRRIEDLERLLLSMQNNGALPEHRDQPIDTLVE